MIGMPDISALGAAYMAGLKVGVYKSIEHLKSLNSNKSFINPANNTKIIGWYDGWKAIVKAKTGEAFIEGKEEIITK